MNTPATAFLFDLDDTLYMRWEPFFRACVSLFPACAALPPEKLYAVRKKYSDHSFSEHLAGRMTREDMLACRSARTLEEFSIKISRSDALHLEQLYEQALADIRLHQEIECILRFLERKGYILGIITNGPAQRQRAKLQALRLDRYIPASHCIISGETGIAKPDTKIFEIAQKRMNLAPHSTWYIGDSLEADIAGANKAGWNTIWFNPSRTPLPAFQTPPDDTADSYTGLFNIIQELCK